VADSRDAHRGHLHRRQSRPRERRRTHRAMHRSIS